MYKTLATGFVLLLMSLAVIFVSTQAANLMNEPSDIEVMLGAVLFFVAFAIPVGTFWALFRIFTPNTSEHTRKEEK